MGQQETIQTKRKLEVKPRIDELVTHIFWNKFINILLLFSYQLCKGDEDSYIILY
jgi:hypothetical protein